MKKELNRIISDRNVKPVTSKELYELLTQKGYILEKQVNGRFVWVQTELGSSKGIVMVDKMAKIGPDYEVLLFPTEVQKEMVEYYISIGERLFSEN